MLINNLFIAILILLILNHFNFWGFLIFLFLFVIYFWIIASSRGFVTCNFWSRLLVVAFLVDIWSIIFSLQNVCSAGFIKHYCCLCWLTIPIRFWLFTRLRVYNVNWINQFGLISLFFVNFIIAFWLFGDLPGCTAVLLWTRNSWRFLLCYLRRTLRGSTLYFSSYLLFLCGCKRKSRWRT